MIGTRRDEVLGGTATANLTGTNGEMARFVTVSKEIFPAKTRTTAAGVNG